MANRNCTINSTNGKTELKNSKYHQTWGPIYCIVLTVYTQIKVSSDKNSISTSVYVRDGNKLLLKKIIKSTVMMEQNKTKIKNQTVRLDRSWKQSWALKNSRTIIGDLRARPLAKQFSELRSFRCFIMLDVDFSRESTGTPRANILSSVCTSTWFTQLWYREPRYTLGMNWATNTDFLRSLLGYRCKIV